MESAPTWSGCGAEFYAEKAETAAPAEKAKTAPVVDDKMGGVLVFGRSGDSVGLDPGRETDGESFYGSTAVFDTLVEFVPGQTAVKPALATSWEVSDDGLEYTFSLRKGVTFHDGTPFNAEAVVFSFERQFIEDHPTMHRDPGNTGAIWIWITSWIPWSLSMTIPSSSC